MSDPAKQFLESSSSNIINAEVINKIRDKQKNSSLDVKLPCIIVDHDFGYIKDENGQSIKVTKYTLNNEQIYVEIINYGATVISCWVPNVLGNLEDILLGFDQIEDYRSRNTFCIGCTLGRVTDDISYDQFKNDEMNDLSKNRGNHHFNGGEKGFNRVMWDGYVSGNKLVLTYSSKDGEEGYPGIFHARITYSLTCKNELIIDYVGMTSKSTPVNITSNMFFNLAGHNTGESEIANHLIMVNADEYVPVKITERRPVGLLKTVNNTCLDLRVPRLLKKAFPLTPNFGYNHTFKLFKGKEKKAFNLAASLVHKPSGRMLDIYTDMPCVLINTAQDFPNYGKMLLDEEILKITKLVTPIATFGVNGKDQEDFSVAEESKPNNDFERMLVECYEDEEENVQKISSTSTIEKISPIIGKSNTIYKKHSGICIRPQMFPDAVTHKNFNNEILKPSNFYNQRVIYKFGVID